MSDMSDMSQPTQQRKMSAQPIYNDRSVNAGGWNTHMNHTQKFLTIFATQPTLLI